MCKLRCYNNNEFKSETISLTSRLLGFYMKNNFVCYYYILLFVC
jgi:hypothetical protein